RAQISRCDIEHCPASGSAFLRQSVSCPCICSEHAGSEFRVGVQLQAVLDKVAVLSVPAGLSAAEDESAVRDPAVVSLELFLADEMYCRVIVGEVVWHRLDLFLYLCRISAFLQNDKALSCVLLPCGKVRILSVSDCLKSRLHRNRVLLCILDALYSADRVGVSLAYTLAPECIVLSVRKDRVGVQPVQGEHSRIPAHGDDSDLAALFRRCVHIGKMLRDPCMCVKAVDHIEHL